MTKDLSRRDFLAITANASALAAAEIGSKKINKLIPYINPPQEFYPGKWIFYNTICRECPAGCGMFLRHQNGRVVKAEGNPLHPVNQGSLCPRGQACVQGLYHPDRLRGISCKENKELSGRIKWNDALGILTEKLQEAKGRVYLISNIQTGSLEGAFKSFIQNFAEGELLYWEPFNYEPQRVAYKELFGKDIIPYYEIEKSDFVISFGADFLEGWISNVQWTKRFKHMHHRESDGDMGRMVYLGPRLSMTAANADEYLQVSPEELVQAARAIVKIVIEKGWNSRKDEKLDEIAAGIPDDFVKNYDNKKLEKLAYKFSHGRSIALAGPSGAHGEQARKLAYAAALLNYSVGNFDKNINMSVPHALSRCSFRREMKEKLASLTKDDVVIFHDCDPVYDIHGAGDMIANAGLKIYIGTMPCSTSSLCDWVLGADHYLESWGDYEPWKGIKGIIQPAMRRIYDTRSSGDIILSLAGLSGSKNFEQSFYDIVKLGWMSNPDNSSNKLFKQGGTWNQKHAKKPVSLVTDSLPEQYGTPVSDKKYELWLWCSVMLYDGRTSSHNWLLENPEPISQIAWDSFVDISLQTARELNVKEGDSLILKNSQTRLEVPARISKDISDNTAALCFGHGRKSVTNLQGRCNAFSLIEGGKDFFGKVDIVKGKKKTSLTALSATRSQHDREILKWEEYEKLTGNTAKSEQITMPLPEGYKITRDVYPPHGNKAHRWAMVIDLDRCIGCGACAIACYAENNIAVMGREALRKGREMAWLKVVPYENVEDRAKIGFLPMLCQHCDAAPCEPVCPVFASVHNEQGLNSQIYNRCIGTRYCSNNCPYKVRRFNWFDTKWEYPSNLQLNPDVTVRCRGVMEKCTFCIQRILTAELDAKKQGRNLKDGEIKPACVQSCPADVFTFGDLLDKRSKVSRIVENDPRVYQVLHDLNTKPAVFYLKRIKVKEI